MELEDAAPTELGDVAPLVLEGGAPTELLFITSLRGQPSPAYFLVENFAPLEELLSTVD